MTPRILIISEKMIVPICYKYEVCAGGSGVTLLNKK